MSNDELMDGVIARGGFGDADEAARAVRVILGVLAQRLSRAEAEGLADELPLEWAEPLRAGRFDRAFELQELFARVARGEACALGIAVEQTGVVCAAVAAALSDAALARLRRALTPDLAALFEPPHASAPPPERAVAGRGHTLADGRPGSRNPISEAAPARAHRDSVVATDNPHGDTKLSSAHGLTQEREAETLATGKPQSGRPLSEGR